MIARKWLLGLAAALAVAAPPAAADAAPVAPVQQAAPAVAADPAEPPDGPGKAYLVAVGVGTFKDAAIHARPTADADAKALHKLLTDKAVLGIPADRAKLLTSETATRDAVVKAVEAAVDATGKGDMIVLAMFGRGATVADKTCFFTADSSFKERGKTALTPADLDPAFKKLKGQKLLFLMDVGYRGFDAGDEKVLEPTLTDLFKLVYGEDDEAIPPPGRVIMFGTPPYRDPLTKGDHGLFYSIFADGLAGKADQKPYFAGYEPDGIVTLQELVKYLDKEIPAAAREIGKTDREKETAPAFVGLGGNRFWVSRNAAETETISKRLDVVAGLVKVGKLTEEDGKEAAGLLARMPKLKWQQDLRKAYQELADKTTTPEQLLATRKTLKDGLKLSPDEAQDYFTKVYPFVMKLSKEYIKPIPQGELTAAAIKGMYARAEEKLPADLEDALKDAKGLTDLRQAELLIDARTRLGRREDLDGDKGVDISLTAAILSLDDPNSLYLDKESVMRTASQIRGRFPGVGIQVRRDAVRDGLLVATPIKGSPAYKAGIQTGDLITEIRLEVDRFGKPLAADAQRVFSTKGMKSDDAVNLILGTEDTPVTLVIQREGLDQPKPFKLNRDFVMVETVSGVTRKPNDDWNYFVDEKYKIAYVRLSQFVAFFGSSNSPVELAGTYTDLKKALTGMKKAGLNGLVLDLRDNPGGHLTSAVSISELFVGQEPIVTVRPRPGGKIEKYNGLVPGDASFPIVVLVNGGSASASEIVAACLQDHGRATIIGERSYGKGSVQFLESYKPTGGQYKYTGARYYPPSGRNIDKLAAQQDPALKDEWGVKPDYGFEVKVPPEEYYKWYEYAQDQLHIPPPGKPAPKIDPEKDKVLQRSLGHLRDLLKATGKAPKE